MTPYADVYPYDFFIAHAGDDKPSAELLYDLLKQKTSVFLDSRCLLPGDNWYEELPEAQRKSRITVVLISSNTDKAYYQGEEIASAIALARKDETTHRVVPVYLEKSPIDSVPYGLRLKYGLTVSDDFNLAAVADRLLNLLDQLQARDLKQPTAETSQVTSNAKTGESSVPLSAPVRNAVSLLCSPNPEERERGISALEQMDGSSAHDARVAALDSSYPDVRKRAAFVLARRGDSRSCKSLIESLKADRNWNYNDVERCLDALGAKAVPVLEYLLSTSLRLRTLEWIVERDIRDAVLLSVVRRLLRDGEPNVRAMAIHVVRKAGDRAAVLALVELLKDRARVTEGSMVQARKEPLVCDRAASALDSFFANATLDQGAREELARFKEQNRDRLA